MAKRMLDCSASELLAFDKRELLESIDILIDGRFVEELKNLMLNFRGSGNQRIIKMKETLETGKVVLSELNN